MAKSDKIGDWFQSELWDRLNVLVNEKELFIHEFVDTRQAGRMVRVQPSDFMAVGESGKTYFIEAKASEVNTTLRSCFSMVSDSQCAMARKLSNVNCSYTFWFYAERRNVIEIWSGMGVATARSNGTPLKAEDKLAEISWPEFKKELERLIN